MKRVILHAGFHKTGTSHVQRTLRANARAIAPFVSLRLKRDMMPLMRAARSYSAMGDIGALAAVGTAFQALLTDTGDTQCLVIAAEELSGHMPGRTRVADYSAAPVVAELYITAIRNRWPDAEVVFHYGTRSAESWLQSAYWEDVTSSSMTLDLDAFMTRHARSADLDGIAAQVAELGLAVHSTPLESATGRFGPAGPVLALCDLPRGVPLIPQAPHNKRLPEALLLDLLAANRAYPDRTARKAAKAAILSRAET